MKCFRDMEDTNGIIKVMIALEKVYGWRGNWRNALDVRTQIIDLLAHQHSVGKRYLTIILNQRPWALVWSGRYKEAEMGLIENLRIYQKERYTQLQDEFTRPQDIPTVIVSSWRDLAYVLGKQLRFNLAAKYFKKAYDYYVQRGIAAALHTLLGFWGEILVFCGDLEEARSLLRKSLRSKIKNQDFLGIPEVLNSLAIAEEIENNLDTAHSLFLESVGYKWVGRNYFYDAALVGLIRVKHALQEYEILPPLLAEAEEVAQQYEYNDHLASLRLTQGHIAWDGHIPEWGSGFDATLHYYQQALIYALRYNRFLLDEVLSGRPQGTPLRPIIPACLQRGQEGRRMLVALRDWWQTGVNDVGTPRPDTISPIPEGIPLLEAERMAREREPGDGSPQKTVVEQIEAALQTMGGN